MQLYREDVQCLVLSGLGYATLDKEMGREGKGGERIETVGMGATGILIV